MKAVENETAERALIEAAQRDPSRFAELYEGNFERVYAYVAHRVATRADAQDVTAEVFHQALASIEQFEWRGAPFIAWLLGISARVLAKKWHLDSQRRETSADVPEWTGLDEKTEQRAILFQLVDRLPDDQRLVIIRRFVQQRSIREIAEEIGRSEGAVKQLQLRALQDLRSQMKENHVSSCR